MASNVIDDDDDDYHDNRPRRLGFQEAMAMTALPSASGSSARRFVSRRPAWKPGNELPWDSLFKNLDGPPVPRHSSAGAYGGHVYAQAPLAAARVVEDEGRGKLGIHTIQGVFTSPGLIDRPFIYDVSPIFSGRSFFACLVKARQPTEASKRPRGPFSPPDSDSALGHVCFSCITTFKRSVPTPDDLQETPSVQERFADLLSSRRPDQWEASPQVDLDMVRDLFPDAGPGGFPILDMHKVDMTEYNASRPVTDRLQLVYYRLLKPLPAEDVNAHIVCHAFEADRNGLIMLANHIGYGKNNLAKGVSLTYSFYMHVNAEEAVMRADGWWLQEVRWPRVSAGRCMMESKLWGPDGRHVASGYQDSIVLPRERKARL
ncbi:hypothetical protein CP532_6834 [Ophiocordyceps camponoti-leonardi (nom. inval.)]|nr:hypothetical protein CP532_6834 [Ophiocordyceps camponoti-leonardi (nom. inval.)]